MRRSKQFPLRCAPKGLPCIDLRICHVSVAAHSALPFSPPRPWFLRSRRKARPPRPRRPLRRFAPSPPTPSAPLFRRAPAQSAPAPSAPPVAPVRSVTTDYFGTAVADPYRYMENLSDPDVAAWFKAQDAYTRGVLAKIPGRDALLARIQELDRSTPAVVSAIIAMPGGRYFYQKTLQIGRESCRG